ncbi:MAG: hypothetical protein LBB49_05505 [Gracilibacteraceae bacterium]|jgi:hypothetical protein|nr:hypothetical protein [Gracilibacteraceae bacterium]
MPDIYTIIEEGVRAAKAAGEPVAQNIIDLASKDFASTDMKMFRLSNELTGIADLLINDFTGVGTQKHTDTINHYAFAYGEKARTFLWDPLPPLPLCDEPALKVDLFELKETIKTVNAHRDKHIAHAARLDASVGSMIWTGDDADTTREQWEHIQGPAP